MRYASFFRQFYCYDTINPSLSQDIIPTKNLFLSKQYFSFNPFVPNVPLMFKGLENACTGNKWVKMVQSYQQNSFLLTNKNGSKFTAITSSKKISPQKHNQFQLLTNVSILQKLVMIYSANRLNDFHMITRLLLNKFNNETRFG